VRASRRIFVVLGRSGSDPGGSLPVSRMFGMCRRFCVRIPAEFGRYRGEFQRYGVFVVLSDKNVP
jgi:hypothetical protein